MEIKSKVCYKQNTEKGDNHKDGDIGYLIARINVETNGMIGYFVLYEDFELPILVSSKRLKISDDIVEIILKQEQIDYIEKLKENLPIEYE